MFAAFRVFSSRERGSLYPSLQLAASLSKSVNSFNDNSVVLLHPYMLRPVVDTCAHSILSIASALLLVQLDGGPLAYMFQKWQCDSSHEGTSLLLTSLVYGVPITPSSAIERNTALFSHTGVRSDIGDYSSTALAKSTAGRLLLTTR